MKKTRMKKTAMYLLVCFFITNAVLAQQINTLGILPGKGIVLGNKNYSTLVGNIEVLEDYNDQNSRKILLPIFIVKSSSSNPTEPIFWLDGGPGASNILSEQKIISVNPSKLLANHDLVCVGYRGVDGSKILKSKKLDKALKGRNNQLLSEKSLNNVEEKIKEYKSQLQKEGVDINNYTMLNVIEDIEAVRKHQGYKNINFLSVSYGTRLALLYSYKYPAIINRSVMIGANPPGHFIWDPEKTESILTKYDSLYKNQNLVDYRGSIKEMMNKSFDKMPKRWSIYKLDADKIKVGTFTSLFSKNMAGLIFEAYHKAANNDDYSYLYILQKMVDINSPTFFSEMSAKAVSADFEKGIDYRKALDGDKTILGGNVSKLFWGTSSAWQLKTIPEEYRKCRESLTETLIISGDLDNSTPSDYAKEELMPHLKNGHQIILKNMSHSDILIKTMITPNFLSDYFDSGTINKEDSTTPDSVDFKPAMKFTKFKIFMMGLVM